MSYPGDTSSSIQQQLFIFGVHMLDYIVPGLSSLLGVIDIDWDSCIEVLRYYPRVLFLIGFIYLYGPHLIGKWLKRTVTFTEFEEAYDMITVWASQHPSYSMRVNMRDERGTHESDDNVDIQKKSLQYTPWNAAFYFKWGCRIFKFQSVVYEGNWRQRTDVSISCYDFSPKTLYRFMEDLRDQHLKKMEERTLIFENRGCAWHSTISKRKRPLDTIVIDRGAKETIIRHVDDFIDPSARRWYSDHSQPYRKGFVFYGPPGTGKSSLCLAIAGHCDLDLYVVHLSRINDQDLSKLFSDLPARCVVLLEDLDAIKSTVSRESDLLQEHIALSLSGLLNALDGITSPEGCIFIMTTNYIERLDTAVIRSGRADVKIELGLVDKPIAMELFDRAYRDFEGIDTDIRGDMMIHFAGCIPDSRFKPADIMSYLKTYREAPYEACRNISEWVKRQVD